MGGPPMAGQWELIRWITDRIDEAWKVFQGAGVVLRVLYVVFGRIKPEEQGRICTDAEARRGGCRVDHPGNTR